MRFVILAIFSIAIASCRAPELKVDPCTILPDLQTCFAVPINQMEKPEYERPIVAGDVCFSPEDYARLAEYNDELLRRCGKNCR